MRMGRARLRRPCPQRDVKEERTSLPLTRKSVYEWHIHDTHRRKQSLVVSVVATSILSDSMKVARRTGITERKDVQGSYVHLFVKTTNGTLPWHGNGVIHSIETRPT
jgi:hypothetical protein